MKINRILNHEPRMRKERHNEAFGIEDARAFQQPADYLSVTRMNAVKRADGNDRLFV